MTGTVIWTAKKEVYWRSQLYNLTKKEQLKTPEKTPTDLSRLSSMEIPEKADSAFQEFKPALAATAFYEYFQQVPFPIVLVTDKFLSLLLLWFLRNKGATDYGRLAARRK